MPLLAILDAFQGYHQIPLALDDQEKTAFVTPIEKYHYKVMPLCLKNAKYGIHLPKNDDEDV